MRVDLRPAVHLFSSRRINHWTPAYLRDRARVLVQHWLHPDEPSLTADSIHLLDQLLVPEDRGIEWGSGNSTGWFAARTAHLTSFESGGGYYAVVAASLRARSLTNVDYVLCRINDADPEERLWETDWVRRSLALPDEAFDYALVDSSPRGINCLTAVRKLRPGGLLILDNADWYIPPPVSMRRTPSAVVIPAGLPGSRLRTTAWPRFMALTKAWKRIWTSDGIQMTLLMFKP